MRSMLILAGATVLASGAALAQTTPPPPAVVTNPDWLRKPTGEDLARVYPKKARSEDMSGTATISCQVKANGTLEQCQTVSEHPEGYGFGDAALRFGPIFQMRSKTPDGLPVEGGTVRIPIIFRTPSGRSMASLVVNPLWRSTPGAAQLAAAYPKAASDIAGGASVVRCDFEFDGKTKTCKVMSQTPARKGFGEAAKTLAEGFVVVPISEAPIPFLLADIPFTFRNPAMPQEPPKWAPQWVRTPSPAGVAKLYPAPALAAKVFTGLGVVSCAASATGEMVDCRQEREEPAGLGFGAAGLEAAKLMAMNPWTEAGEPVAGRRVTLPIRFKLEDPPGPTTAP